MSAKLRLATYNIRNGKSSKAVLRNLKKMETVEGVNLFCLQEVRQFGGKNFIVEEIREALGADWQLQYFIHPDSFDLGLCMLWKTSEMELLDMEKLFLPKLFKPRLMVK